MKTNSALRQKIGAQQAAFIAKLREQSRALILSCGDNLLSHAPFVFYNDCYYILVSTLAARTQALLTSGTGQIMLLKDEAATGNIYSRRRLSQRIRAEIVATDSEEYPLVIAALQARHGKTVALLRQLPDFRLIRLIPGEGQLIMGFGQAFDIPSPDSEGC